MYFNSQTRQESKNSCYAICKTYFFHSQGIKHYRLSISWSKKKVKNRCSNIFILDINFIIVKYETSSLYLC